MSKVLEVADRWFHVESLSDDVTLIHEPEVHPFIQGNIWHIRGRARDLLVDTGTGVRSLRAELPRLTERPIVCVATHCHFDHWGGLHEFDERLGHKLEAEVYAAPTGKTTVADKYISESSFKRLPRAGYEPLKYTVQAAPLTRYVDEGDVIDLGDRVFRVLHLPGHSPGQIGILEERTGLLFSGDAIYDGILFDDFYEEGPKEFVQTMHRLREMPITTVHGGHHASFNRQKMIEIVGDYMAGRRRPGCPNEHGHP
jgi:glyoxylase-like metal-dependent hydrolase (beta-lactamase superfamily II)